jgi:hypothetical protein
MERLGNPRRRWVLRGLSKTLHALIAAGCIRLTNLLCNPTTSAEIEIAKRPDGSDWLLGSGGFGKVGLLQDLIDQCCGSTQQF